MIGIRFKNVLGIIRVTDARFQTLVDAPVVGRVAEPKVRWNRAFHAVQDVTGLPAEVAADVLDARNARDIRAAERKPQARELFRDGRHALRARLDVRPAIMPGNRVLETPAPEAQRLQPMQN